MEGLDLPLGLETFHCQYGSCYKEAGKGKLIWGMRVGGGAGESGLAALPTLGPNGGSKSKQESTREHHTLATLSSAPLCQGPEASWLAFHPVCKAEDKKAILFCRILRGVHIVVVLLAWQSKRQAVWPQAWIKKEHYRLKGTVMTAPSQKNDATDSLLLAQPGGNWQLLAPSSPNSEREPRDSHADSRPLPSHAARPGSLAWGARGPALSPTALWVLSLCCECSED